MIAEPEKDVRETLAFVLGAMDGARIVHSAATADDAERWLATHPDDWDVALVDAQLVDDVSPGLRKCGRQAPAEQTVIVLCDEYSAQPPAPLSADLAHAWYDKRYDIDRIASLCMHLRNTTGRTLG